MTFKLILVMHFSVIAERIINILIYSETAPNKCFHVNMNENCLMVLIKLKINQQEIIYLFTINFLEKVH